MNGRNLHSPTAASATCWAAQEMLLQAAQKATPRHRPILRIAFARLANSTTTPEHSPSTDTQKRNLGGNSD